MGTCIAWWIWFTTKQENPANSSGKRSCPPCKGGPLALSYEAQKPAGHAGFFVWPCLQNSFFMPLFNATSTLTHLEWDGVSLRDVTVHWYYNAERSSRQYARLIENYKRLDPPTQRFGERVIDELLTPTEVEQIETFLTKLTANQLQLASEAEALVQARSVSFPLEANRMGFRDMPVGGLTGRFALDDFTGQSTPFPVGAYFDLGLTAYDDRVEQSIQYVHRALQMLERDAGVPQSEIERVVKELHDRSGLYVMKGGRRRILEKLDVDT